MCPTLTSCASTPTDTPGSTTDSTGSLTSPIRGIRLTVTFYNEKYCNKIIKRISYYILNYILICI